jgi:hypothetical protein
MVQILIKQPATRVFPGRGPPGHHRHRNDSDAVSERRSQASTASSLPVCSYAHSRNDLDVSVTPRNPRRPRTSMRVRSNPEDGKLFFLRRSLPSVLLANRNTSARGTATPLPARWPVSIRNGQSLASEKCCSVSHAEATEPSPASSTSIGCDLPRLRVVPCARTESESSFGSEPALATR